MPMFTAPKLGRSVCAAGFLNEPVFSRGFKNIALPIFACFSCFRVLKKGQKSSLGAFVVRLHFFEEQADELLQEVEVFGSGDGLDLLHEPVASFDLFDEVLTKEGK